MLKRTKFWSIFACSIIFLGGIIFGITAINVNFNFDKMFYEYNYTARDYETNLSTINNINIDLKDVKITVCFNNNGNFKLSYNEYENKVYKITNEDGQLNITIDDKKWFDYLTFKLPLNNNATIYIPSDYSNKITIKDNSNNVVFTDESLANMVEII